MNNEQQQALHDYLKVDGERAALLATLLSNLMEADGGGVIVPPVKPVPEPPEPDPEPELPEPELPEPPVTGIPNVIDGVEILEFTNEDFTVQFTLTESKPLAVRYGKSRTELDQTTPAQVPPLMLHIQRPKILAEETFFQAFDPVDGSHEGNIESHVASAVVIPDEPETPPEVIETKTGIVFPISRQSFDAGWAAVNHSESAPAYRQSRIEPNGLTLSSVSTSGTVHHYSRRQAFNADETLIDIGQTIVDAKTLNVTGMKSGLDGERNWSNLDPDLMYGIVQPGAFARSNIKTGKVTKMRTFSGFKYLSFGDWEGNISSRDERVLLVGWRHDGSKVLIAFDIANNVILNQIEAASNLNWASYSHLGNYIVVENNTYPDPKPEMYRYDANLANPKLILQNSPKPEHGDFAFDDQGNEVYAMIMGDMIRYIRLKDGKLISLPNTRGIGYGHLSGRNERRRGWAYFTSEKNYHVGAVKLSETGSVVEHWGFNRTTSANYAAQPKGTASRSGHACLFSSDWFGRGGAASDYLLACGTRM